MRFYFDSTATTHIREEVINEIDDTMRNYYGNPSSLHRMGLEVEKKINSYRENIARDLRVNRDEIYFTSGGTESNNISIQGILNRYKNRRVHIITSKIEHPSVLNVFKSYEDSENVDISYIDVDGRGQVDLNQLEKSICEDTILVSIMMVNNEVGSIQPISRISDIIKGKNKNTYFHVDGVQAFGKIGLNLRDMGVDLFSFSAHKVYGPKGVGGLYIKKDVNLSPIMYGGGQEGGISPGTENTTGIVGLGKAFEIMIQNREKEYEYVLGLKRYLLESLTGSIDDIGVNSPEEEGFSPYIVNVSFPKTRGEIILHSLESEGIFVSTTSACSSKDKTESHVLRAMSVSSRDIEGSIRISFSYLNTFKEIDILVEKLKKSVEEIRSIMR